MLNVMLCAVLLFASGGGGVLAVVHLNRFLRSWRSCCILHSRLQAVVVGVLGGDGVGGIAGSAHTSVSWVLGCFLLPNRSR